MTTRSSSSAPHPGLHDLEPLDDVRSAGLHARLHVDGEPFDLPPSPGLSAYRILQEGLTNVLEHGQARHADDELAYDDGRLRIEVRDDGRGPSVIDGLANGLVGVAERVKIFGGEMSSGACPGGGFVLRTRPLDRR
jgi:signal transduction histidine kinase